jgi:hypothetical protein
MENIGRLNIGLTYFQECQWIDHIRQYGISILNKSLLTKDQKNALINAANIKQEA